MNRNTLTGFVLIALVLIGFSWWSQKQVSEQQAAEQARQIAEQAAKMARETVESKGANLKNLLRPSPKLFFPKFLPPITKQGTREKFFLPYPLKIF